MSVPPFELEEEGKVRTSMRRTCGRLKEVRVSESLSKAV